MYEDMKQEAARDFAYFGVTADDLVFEKTADIHYANQYHELELKMPDTHITRPVLDNMTAKFHQLHKDTFSFDLPWVPIQIINVRLTARMKGLETKLNKIGAGTADASAALKQTRETYIGKQAVPLPIYDGDKLRAGNVVKGPCVIEQNTATSVIPAGNTCRVDEYGNFIVDKED